MLIETGDRVFEIEEDPSTRDVPGVCRLRVTLVQLSGPPLTDEEWGRVVPVVIADAVGSGLDVIGWELGDSP